MKNRDYRFCDECTIRDDAYDTNGICAYQGSIYCSQNEYETNKMKS